VHIFSSCHEPYWLSSISRPDYAPLTEAITVDVAIIGGGLVGITSALLLKEQGLKVAVNVEGPAFLPLKHLGEGKNKKDPNIF
jgi:ribulose 1,5-bisphosphate synthetase/thiazole synthase